jgi:hypothetical protein
LPDFHLAAAPQEWSNSSMEFHCDDLPQFGVTLIPPSSPEYDRLLLDIQQRSDHPQQGLPSPPASMRPKILEEDRETSAILLNRSQHSIAEIQQVWTFEEESGRSYTSSIGGGANPSVLLPFGLSEKVLNLYRYWKVILPGSKRYLGRNGEQVGDNSDVRPPGPDEVSTGGGWGIGRGGGGGRSRGPLRKVTLTLDGVFFDDGGFAGRNQKGLWEQIVQSAEAHLRVAAMARQAHDDGEIPQKILAAIETVTGPATDHPPPPLGDPRTPETYRESALKRLAWEIGRARKSQGDERAVYMLLAWANEPVPHFHKL